MRLFIAINFSDTIKESLYQLIQELKKNSEQGNFTHKDNLHLTLAFIGETTDHSNVERAINNAISKTNMKSFDFSIEGFGAFKRKEGDIYWVGVKPNQYLTQLNRSLVKELKNFEFKIDDKEFKPHLTLGRRVVVLDKFDLNKFEQSIPSMEVKVDRISLMKSERIDGKLVYTEIYYTTLIHE